jgi:two-component system sensor histidine kinase QseC
MSSFSLRRRLLGLLLGAVGTVWLLLALSSYFDAHHEIDEVFDAQLAQSAQLLLAQATHDIDEIDFEHERFKHKYQRRFIFQILDQAGHVLFHSAGAPSVALTSQAGYSDVPLNGERWRVFARWDADNEYQIQVAERHAMRSELARNIALRMLLPALAALPLLALLIWLGVSKGLAPLGRIAQDVSGRAPQHLTPLDTQRSPREILPLIEALNGLFSRLNTALENERRFTADAAHELRTPLAALRVQAQVALRSQDDAERRHAIEQVVAGTDRATHLVEQLLTLARLDPDAARAAHQPLDLRFVAMETLSLLAPAVVAKHIELSLTEGPSVMVQGDAGMLGILLRNLVDNAVRYTPEGGAVTVAIYGQNGRVVLEVSDTGPGIASTEREHVLQRFYRGTAAGASGSGLGLSIVRRVAELHDAALYLSDGEGGRGLRVRVLLQQARKPENQSQL